jgi:putative DNA primase/helicase
VLGVAEGIETALAAHAISRMPVWSCVSAPLLELVDIPEYVKFVVIWADLDVSNRGLIAAEKLADRLEAMGKKVEICLPYGPIPEGVKGVDWLDVLLAQGVNGFPARWRRWRPGK